MPPASPLLSGYIYVMDWKTDDDMDLQDLAGKTEGTNYVCCAIPESVMDACDDGKKITYLPGGTNFGLALGLYQNYLRFFGVLSAATIGNLMTSLKYWKSYQEAKKTTKNLYMTIKFDTNTYWPFKEGSTDREYSKGCFATPGIQYDWRENKYFFINVGWTWAQLF